MQKLLIALMLCVGMVNTIYPQQGSLEKIDSKHFKNLYKVDNDLYRSEQPSKKGFQEIESLGVKTILNFRRLWDNTKKAKNFNFNLVNLPLKAKLLNEDDIVKALSIIQNSEKPVLVHCWHGSDRTGAIVAAYRILFDNWSKENAIAEFRIKDLGYHYKMYPNLEVLLQNLDVEKIKIELEKRKN
jgi:protein tyrosine/serine phosphatase